MLLGIIGSDNLRDFNEGREGFFPDQLIHAVEIKERKLEKVLESHYKIPFSLISLPAKIIKRKIRYRLP